MTRTRNDLELYEREGDGWWDPTCRAFCSLRSVQAFHLELLLSWLGPSLDGMRVVDLGCGGGLLSVPLARRGARVVGVDLSGRSLACARRKSPIGTCCYASGDVLRAPVSSESADLVLLADVIEHVDQPRAAILEVSRLLRPGGHAFVTTLNRTLRSRLLAVTLAEGLRLVPPGTHDARMFVRPDEILEYSQAAGLECERMQGEGVNLGKTIRNWCVSLRPSSSLAVSYSVLLRKGAE